MGYKVELRSQAGTGAQVLVDIRKKTIKTSTELELRGDPPKRFRRLLNLSKKERKKKKNYSRIEDWWG